LLVGQAGQLISALIGVLLLAGISAMIWVGPRVLESMGKQYEPWRILAKRSKRGLPIRAIWLQSSISIFLVLTASFEGILYYSGFVLQLFTMLAVYGLIRLRIRKPKAAWVSPLFPIAQWLYLAFSAYALIYMLFTEPTESLLGLLNVATGIIAYLMGSKQQSLGGSGYHG
ncbi:MAG: amino acid permease, partial [Bacteroidota bacterium]